MLSTAIGAPVYTDNSGQSPDKNIEALIGLQYTLFHFTIYQVQIQSFTYPGLSDAGRFRATPKANLSVKLTNNFYASFSFWDNYDSRPPANSKGNELGLSSGLGWSF